MVWFPNLCEDRVLRVASHQVARELRLEDSGEEEKIEVEIEIGNITSVAFGLLGVKRKKPPYF